MTSWIERETPIKKYILLKHKRKKGPRIQATTLQGAVHVLRSPAIWKYHKLIEHSFSTKLTQHNKATDQSWTPTSKGTCGHFTWSLTTARCQRQKKNRQDYAYWAWPHYQPITWRKPDFKLSHVHPQQCGFTCSKWLKKVISTKRELQGS